jgi:serine/threonine protein kinase
MDARVRLGDFGNALHISELPQYFEEYEIQSMPYRAPEVLLGLRFNSAIDVWSLGIMLIELVIGKTLFHGNSREEAIRDIGSTIGKLSKLRFSSGKFAHCLLQAARLQAGSSPGFVPSSAVDSSSQWNRNEQVKSIRRLLSKHVSSSNIPHNEWYALIDFLTCLTAVDPSHRISPFDALQHNFLVDEINLPIGVVAQTVQDAEDQSSAAARASKRRRLVSGASLFHSLKYY